MTNVHRYPFVPAPRQIRPDSESSYSIDLEFERLSRLPSRGAVYNTFYNASGIISALQPFLIGSARLGLEPGVDRTLLGQTMEQWLAQRVLQNLDRLVPESQPDKPFWAKLSIATTGDVPVSGPTEAVAWTMNPVPPYTPSPSQGVYPWELVRTGVLGMVLPPGTYQFTMALQVRHLIDNVSRWSVLQRPTNHFELPQDWTPQVQVIPVSELAAVGAVVTDQHYGPGGSLAVRDYGLHVATPSTAATPLNVGLPPGKVAPYYWVKGSTGPPDTFVLQDADTNSVALYSEELASAPFPGVTETTPAMNVRVARWYAGARFPEYGPPAVVRPSNPARGSGSPATADWGVTKISPMSESLPYTWQLTLHQTSFVLPEWADQSCSHAMVDHLTMKDTNGALAPGDPLVVSDWLNVTSRDWSGSYWGDGVYSFATAPGGTPVGDPYVGTDVAGQPVRNTYFGSLSLRISCVTPASYLQRGTPASNGPACVGLQRFVPPPPPPLPPSSCPQVPPDVPRTPSPPPVGASMLAHMTPEAVADLRRALLEETRDFFRPPGPTAAPRRG